MMYINDPRFVVVSVEECFPTGNGRSDILSVISHNSPRVFSYGSEYGETKVAAENLANTDMEIKNNESMATKMFFLLCFNDLHGEANCSEC
mmetsp:Transcript_33604/g.77525  ORF Transcript_33604/g.77525 Transcript_33604/m.77525 type:complete len:91 (+) Transcript_33604:1896-2168(+)